jgi:oligopeptide/dipeptide ABC transporter ATP-binding protein
MPEPILSAQGLWKSFGGHGFLGSRNRSRRPALVDASLTLGRGQILGVVGESGSGKTTLARCLSLLMRPDTGSVTLDGEELTTLPVSELRRRRRQIQTVFQDPYASLNPRMQVGDAIGEVLSVHALVPRRQIPARVKELLDTVGIAPSSVNRYPSDFSGGQRQRICIARALAAEPDVLIADEAVSALDVSIRAQILNLLLDLRDGLGLSMIFIGHDLFVVGFVADSVAVMLGGQIIEVLPKLTTLASAIHPYTQELLAAAPTLSDPPSEPAQAPEPASSAEPPIVSCPYWLRCPIRSDERCGREYPRLRALGAGHWVASFCELPGSRAPAQDQMKAAPDPAQTANSEAIR